MHCWLRSILESYVILQQQMQVLESWNWMRLLSTRDQEVRGRGPDLSVLLLFKSFSNGWI